MDDDPRGAHPVEGVDPAPSEQAAEAGAHEKELLASFLDYQRETLLWKLSGLTDEQLRRTWTPTGLSLLGLVKHLGYVEHNWFQGRFMGGELLRPWLQDPGVAFRIEPDETAESVLAFYRGKVAESRRIVDEAASLDTIAREAERSPDQRRALRRILVHMIQETARHNGHADLMRELTDGRTGE